MTQPRFCAYISLSLWNRFPLQSASTSFLVVLSHLSLVPFRAIFFSGVPRTGGAFEKRMLREAF